MFYKTGIAIILLLFLVWVSGCWSSREINNMAFAIGTGVDLSPEGYRITDQILNSSVIAEKSGVEAPFYVYSENGEDLLRIKRRMTTVVPRKIFNAHLRVLILGEALARSGIGKVLDFFQRGHEYRDDFYIIVAKGSTAEDVLKIVTPLETVSGVKVADSLRTAEKVWAPVKSVRLFELLNSLISEGQNPVLTGVEIDKTQPDSSSVNGLKQSDISPRLKLAGLGVFKKDELVGWLNEFASIGYNFIMGNVKSTAGFIEYDSRNTVGAEAMAAKSKIKVSSNKGKPAIRVEINIKGNITAVYGTVDISKMPVIAKVQQKINAKVARECREAVYLAQTEFQSDIFGFGEAIHRAKPKLWKKLKKNWDQEFVRLPVRIVVKTKIEQLGQVTKPLLGK